MTNSVDSTTRQGRETHTSAMPSDSSENLLQALAARPNAVRWKMALTGEITDIGDAIYQVRGLTPAQAKTQPVDQIHPPASLQISLDYFERFSRALLEGRAPESFHADLEYFHADGSTVLCEVMALPIVDDLGAVVGLVGVSVPTGKTAGEPASD